jgi:hypothetical protein
VRKLFTQSTQPTTSYSLRRVAPRLWGAVGPPGGGGVDCMRDILILNEIRVKGIYIYQRRGVRCSFL